MRQQGVALVSVLLIVAIATVMAVTMVREQQSAIQTARGYLARGQAMQYALGGEELARQILYEDFAEGTGRDHLTEVWANPELQFEFEEGEVNLMITDLQGLINLNSLADANPGRELSRQRLVNLLLAVSIDQTLVDRVQDWIDEDTGNRPGGAEDFDYLALDPPYRTSNQPLASVTELRLMGLPPEQSAQLMPWITALPTPEAPLNINTAPPGVLQSLSPSLTFAVAESLAITRDEQEGFETVEAFLQAPELAGLGIQGDGLGVQSSFFEVRVIARYQDKFSYLTSLVHRSRVDGSLQVLSRSFARSFRPAATTPKEDA